MIAAPSRWLRWFLWVFCLATVLLALLFAARSYRSWLLLRSAYTLNAPELAGLRAWMTLEYISRLYGVTEMELRRRLRIAPDTAGITTLRILAQQAGMAPFDYVRWAQTALAPGFGARTPIGAQQPGWIAFLNDTLLSALLQYGYPAFGVTLAAASIGLPLPSGLLTAAAGSLIAQGQMSWLVAGLVAVSATVLGDLVGFALGRLLGGAFLDRHGRWFGYTPTCRRRAEQAFERWGWASVVLTRTLVSSVSSAVNLAAGTIGYRALPFAAAATVGRMVWTSAYLALGYGVGGALETANGFLANLTGLLVAMALTAGGIWLLARQRQASAPHPAIL
jgi:membrane protein DedA with SNARE-associated domain